MLFTGKHTDGVLYNKGPSYSGYSGYIMMPNMNNDPYMSNGSLSPPIPRTVSVLYIFMCVWLCVSLCGFLCLCVFMQWMKKSYLWKDKLCLSRSKHVVLITFQKTPSCYVAILPSESFLIAFRHFNNIRKPVIEHKG